MSISIRLKQYLDKESVAYEHRVHPTAYTSQEIAAVAHIPGREMAKTVILKADDKLVIAVLSANDKVDLDALQGETGSKITRLSTELSKELSRKENTAAARFCFGIAGIGLPTVIPTKPTVTENLRSRYTAKS